MKKFNDNWKFLKLNNKSDFFSFKKNLSSAVNISLPHDWLIGNVSNLYENSKGGIRKTSTAMIILMNMIILSDLAVYIWIVKYI